MKGKNRNFGEPKLTSTQYILAQINQLPQELQGDSEAQEKWQRRQTTIIQLLLSPQLLQWKRDFLITIQGKRSLSPKQQEILARIEAKVGGQG